MKTIVSLSGGAASWAAARRSIDQFGRDDLTLLDIIETPVLVSVASGANRTVGTPDG